MIATNIKQSEYDREVAAFDAWVKRVQAGLPAEWQSLPVLDESCFGVHVEDSGESEMSWSASLGESNVYAFSGLRGSGKSLSLAYLTAKALSLGMTCLSNMEVKYVLIPIQGPPRLCETKPLDWNSVYLLDTGLQNAIVVADELLYWLDSRQSMTLRSRLINSCLNQIRKRSLSFAFSVKDMGWLDKRLALETDLEFGCTDSAMTIWGKTEHLKKGTLIFWKIFDKSGTTTGRRFQDSGIVYPGQLHHAERLWPIFNSYEVIDYLQATQPLRREQTPLIISDQVDLGKVLEPLIEVVRNDGGTISVEEMRNQVNTYLTDGHREPVSDVVLGRTLAKMGLRPHRLSGGRSFYDLKEN